MEFKITDKELVLAQLLKLMGIAETGGHAKVLINSGEVVLNGETEYRKRARLKAGDTVTVGNQLIHIVA